MSAPVQSAAPTNGMRPVPKDKPAWLYADAVKEQKLLAYFLKDLVEDSSGRHGNLRLALAHTRRLLQLIQALLEQEEES